MAACSLFYARCQRVLATLLIIDAAHKLNDVVSGWSASGVRLMCMPLSPWSMLYFVQLVPSIGHFVVAIQRMVGQMFNFADVYAIFFFASVSAFFITVNTSERLSCSDEFSSITQALYSTFAIMLSLLTPGRAAPTSPRLDVHAAYRVHVHSGNPSHQLPHCHHVERALRGGPTTTNHRAPPATVSGTSHRVSSRSPRGALLSRHATSTFRLRRGTHIRNVGDTSVQICGNHVCSQEQKYGCEAVQHQI